MLLFMPSAPWKLKLIQMGLIRIEGMLAPP